MSANKHTKESIVNLISESNPFKDKYKLSIRIDRGGEEVEDYGVLGSGGNDHYNKFIYFTEINKPVWGYDYFRGTLNISPFPMYCGAYLVHNLGQFYNERELLAIRLLRFLYEKSEKGKWSATGYICCYYQPRFIMFDIDNDHPSGFPILKGIATKVKLGKNNNSNNNTAMWIIEHDHLIAADKFLTEKYIPKVEPKVEPTIEPAPQLVTNESDPYI